VTLKDQCRDPKCLIPNVSTTALSAVIHNFIRQMTAQIKQVKTKKNKT